MSNVLKARYGQAANPELMEMFYAGDDGALHPLVCRLQSSLWHQAYRQLPVRHPARRQVAEDIVQIVWIKVAATRARPAVCWARGKGTVRGWIGTILRNAVVSYLRSPASRQLVAVDLGWESDNGMLESVESQWVDHRLEQEAAARDTEQLRQRLLVLVSQLPEKVRSILYMKLEGLSHQQIAGRLGLSKSTIGYHFREAKQLLRAQALAA